MGAFRILHPCTFCSKFSMLALAVANLKINICTIVFKILHFAHNIFSIFSGTMVQISSLRKLMKASHPNCSGVLTYKSPRIKLRLQILTVTCDTFLLNIRFSFAVTVTVYCVYSCIELLEIITSLVVRDEMSTS